MNGTEQRPDQMPPAADEAAAPGPAQPPTGAAPPPGWVPPRAPMDPRRKSPILACILSIMPGLGQVYIGYYKLGFIHLAVFASSIAMAVAVANSHQLSDGLIPLFVLFTIFFFLYNIVDAGRRAAFYNQALDGVAGVELPQDMNLPSSGGSMFGGGVLVVIGLILLSNTVFGFTLAWLEQWWPLAPIAVGVWLLWRGMQERAAA